MDAWVTWARGWGHPPTEGLAAWLAVDLVIHAVAIAVLGTVLGLLVARPDQIAEALRLFVPAGLIGRLVGVAGQVAWWHLRHGESAR